MKKTNFIKTVLLLCALIVGSGSAWAETITKWVKTAPADLATGDVVAIIDLNNTYALPNDKGASTAPNCVTGTVLKADKSEITSEVAAKLQWVVTKNVVDDVAQYKFNVSGTDNYLTCTTSNNGVRVGTTANNTYKIVVSGGVEYLQNIGTSRYIGLNGSTDWRCYTSINTNVTAAKVTFYKKTEIEETRTAIEVSFPEDEYNAILEEGFTKPVLTITPNTYDGTVTYASSDEDVATVASDGTITLNDVGTTVITATAPATTNYREGSAYYTLTVGSRQIDVIDVDLTGITNNTYTDWSDKTSNTCAVYAGNSCKGNGVIQIKNESKKGIISTTSAGRAKKVSVKWNSSNSNNRKMIVYGRNTAYTSTTELWDSSKGEELGTLTYSTGTTKASLEIPNEKDYAYIGIVANGGTIYLDDIKVEWDIQRTATINDTYKWASFSSVNALNFTGITDLTAYRVSTVTASSATLEAVTGTVAANTGLLVNGETTNIPVVASGTTFTSDQNKLVAVSEATTLTSSDNAYVLTVDDKDNVIFGKVEGTSASVSAGQAYLDGSGVSARELSFDFGNGETTGINEVNSQKSAFFGDFYTLAGQRVTCPTKGLYIVNGKKVIIK